MQEYIEQEKLLSASRVRAAGTPRDKHLEGYSVLTVSNTVKTLRTLDLPYYSHGDTDEYSLKGRGTNA